MYRIPETDEYPYVMDTSQICDMCPYRTDDDYEMPYEDEMDWQYGYNRDHRRRRRRRRRRPPFAIFHPFFFPFFW